MNKNWTSTCISNFQTNNIQQQILNLNTHNRINYHANHANHNMSKYSQQNNKKSILITSSFPTPSTSTSKINHLSLNYLNVTNNKNHNNNSYNDSVYQTPQRKQKEFKNINNQNQNQSTNHTKTRSLIKLRPKSPYKQMQSLNTPKTITSYSVPRKKRQSYITVYSRLPTKKRTESVSVYRRQYVTNYNARNTEYSTTQSQFPINYTNH